MRSKLAIVLILILSFFLRFYQLGHNPPALNTDEAAIGYNAYSILKTGHDEYGQLFPLAFRSFDDYKPPLYIYLTVPSVALLGLNEIAVRLPAAILGVLAVGITYLLTLKLFRRQKIALLASLLLAVSPWHILLSRTAFETGGLAFFTAAGAFFYLKGKDRKYYYLLSVLFFGLSPFLYQAAKVFTPILIFTLLSHYFWSSSDSWKSKFLIASLFIVTLLPTLLSLLSPEGSLRFRGLSIFSDSRPAMVEVLQRQVDWLRGDNPSALIFHHPELANLRVFMTSYLSHFRPDFLFLGSGDTRLPYFPNFGLLYLWELPFLILGFYFLWRYHLGLAALFLTIWFLAAPLPASAVVGAPNSIRTASMLPGVYLIIALGFIYLLKNLRSFAYPFVSAALALVLIYGLALYQHEMYIHSPKEYSQTWYYSYKEVVQQAQKLAPDYDRIIVSNSLDEPYIFFLFYSKKDPTAYQKSGGTVSGGFRSDQNKFDKYSFVFLDWDKLAKAKKTLIIGAPGNIPQGMSILKKFYYLDGTPSVYFATRP